MKQIYKSYKFRLYPNKNQKELIEKTFGCCRFYWNNALRDNIEYYKEHKKSKINQPTVYKEKYEFLKDVDAQALTNTRVNLQKSFNNFFKNKNSGFPKFKSKHYDKYPSYTASQSLKIKQGYIHVPKLKWIKCKW